MNPLLEAYKTHIGGETFLGQPVDLHDPGTLVTSQFWMWPESLKMMSNQLHPL